MSMKALIIAVAVGGAAYAAMQSGETPAAGGVAGADSAAAVKPGIGSKVKRGFGSIGVFFIDGFVRDMTEKTELKLTDIRPALKGKRGADGDRARKAVKTVEQMDSIALASLDEKAPIRAVNAALKAKSFVGVARTNLGMPSE